MNQPEIYIYLKSIYPKWVSTKFIWKTKESCSEENLSFKMRKLFEAGFVEKKKIKCTQDQIVCGFKYSGRTRPVWLWRVKKPSGC